MAQYFPETCTDNESRVSDDSLVISTDRGEVVCHIFPIEPCSILFYYTNRARTAT